MSKDLMKKIDKVLNERREEDIEMSEELDDLLRTQVETIVKSMYNKIEVFMNDLSDEHNLDANAVRAYIYKNILPELFTGKGLLEF